MEKHGPGIAFTCQGFELLCKDTQTIVPEGHCDLRVVHLKRPLPWQQELGRISKNELGYKNQLLESLQALSKVCQRRQAKRHGQLQLGQVDDQGTNNYNTIHSERASGRLKRVSKRS